MKVWSKVVALGFLLALTAQPEGRAKELSEASIYHLDSEWITQDKATINIKDLKGKKQVVSLIYTHCMHTCPTIVATMQEIQKTLPVEYQDKVGFVLISLTPGSDTPEVLKSFAERRKLDPEYWTLLTGTPRDVRTLAMAMNIKYKKSDDNEVAHSNLMTVLDEEGRILFQQVGNIDKANETLTRIIK
ncbi:SCO family protein [Kangiella sediminilitoris]|uniref:Electron transport protein SCO1/SenC n=1 Tax=Kangiella sediminilitoris TaxID=1144748 RepID=A0A1B3B8X9_9GAMM|nr:SCO family protein [Kangiella sediminilitoris]AOE49257.1 Electron transport protein SCO1/SenC [Kangiella sediminilitoris]